MDKLQTYLDLVPLPLVLLGAMASILVFFLVPGRLRCPILLMILPSVLFASKCPDLDVIQSVTKLASGPLLMALAVAAVIEPGPKRALPGIAFVYVLAAVYSLFCITGIQSLGDGMLLKGQWVVMTIAGLSLSRCVVTMMDLDRLLSSVAIGAIISQAIPASSIALQQGKAFVAGLSRLAPWGAGSNIIGVTLMLSASLALYMVLKTPNGPRRLFYIGAFVAGVGFVVLTGSRMSAFSMAIIAFILLLPYLKNLGLLLVLGIMVLGGLSFFLSFDEGAGERLASLDSSGRLEIWAEYFRVSLSRPLGLLGTSGQDLLQDNSIGNHAHNAWIDAIYVGGYPLLLMYAVILIPTIVSTIRFWRYRNRWPTVESGLAARMLLATLVAMFAQSNTNQALLYPTYVWALLGVTFFPLVTSLSRDLSRTSDVDSMLLALSGDTELHLIEEDCALPD